MFLCQARHWLSFTIDRIAESRFVESSPKDVHEQEQDTLTDQTLGVNILSEPPAGQGSPYTHKGKNPLSQNHYTSADSLEVILQELE
ncbi:hypothetical protein N7520_010192 [Penicillium odoratum]|uniref:uncharacterized protein n=1 Tax=Penicillium odoratum TaxID=1167516 RepID=UPI0025465AF3|nr:uncharacterized protein N7520_010192 [Penicillium odoratum]KAJ5753275.1 hypothetical protein N7520_010192 [Penicillium odoratum]